MNHFRNLLTTLPFCAALVISASAATPIQDRDDEHRDDLAHHRYYDQEHKDYHQWNNGEQRYWRQYQTNQHQPHVKWERSSEEQRRAYWSWRHEQNEHHDKDHDHDDHDRH